MIALIKRTNLNCSKISMAETQKPKYIYTELGKEKYCPKCDEYYPATLEFFYGKTKADPRKLESCCKACYMERKRSYKSAERCWGLGRMVNGRLQVAV